MEIEQMKECSFKPQIYTKKPPAARVQQRSQTPIHERIGELQKEKDEHIQRLRLKNE